MKVFQFRLLADKGDRRCVMESANEPQLQLLRLSNDPAHMKGLTAMLHTHGIQTMTEPTSLPWQSAGLEFFVMVLTEDYPKASALYLDFELTCGMTGTARNLVAIAE